MILIFSVRNSCTHLHFTNTHLAGFQVRNGFSFQLSYISSWYFSCWHSCTTKIKHLYFLCVSKFPLASSTPTQIGLLMSQLTILSLWLSLTFFQIFHTFTQLVFRCISFLATGRYYLLRESNREHDLLG